MNPSTLCRRLAILAAVCTSAAAFAGPVLTTGPVSNDRGGWSLSWHLYNHGNFNQLQFLAAQGQFATPAAIDGFIPTSWSQQHNDAALVVANGARTNDLYYTLHFAGSPSQPVEFYMQAWDNDQILIEISYYWDGYQLTDAGGSVWSNVRVDADCPAVGKLQLIPNKTCVKQGEIFTVTIELTENDLPDYGVTSGQFFLGYDPARVEFKGAAPGTPPLVVELYEDFDSGLGTIDYAIGLDLNDPNASSGAVGDIALAVLTFEALNDDCNRRSMVAFRQNAQPTILNVVCCDSICPILYDMPRTSIDDTPPEFTNCLGFDPQDPIYSDPNTPGYIDPYDPLNMIVVECDELDILYPIRDTYGNLLVYATDNCAAPSDPYDPDYDPNYAVLVTFKQDPPEGDVAIPNDDCLNVVITRTWTAVDRCGNQRQCRQVINLVDTTSPTLHACPRDELEEITIECDEVDDLPNNVYATDNCDANPTVELNLSKTYLNDPNDPNEPYPDCRNNYDMERVWTATDACGNTACCVQLVHVRDTRGPVLIYDPNVVLPFVEIECSDVDTLPGEDAVTATADNCPNDPNDPNDVRFEFIEIWSDHGYPCNNTLTRVWAFTDRCGNTSEFIQLVSVVDTLAPIISNCPGDIDVQPGMMPATPTVTASDNCATSLVSTYAETTNPNGSVTRVWSFTDQCGNTNSCEQTVTFTAPPCPGDVNGDSVVDMEDLLIVLQNYGNKCTFESTITSPPLDGVGQ